MAVTLSSEKILITGATGQVANPVAKALAVDNEVWAVARFGNARARKDLEDARELVEVITIESAQHQALRRDVAQRRGDRLMQLTHQVRSASMRATAR